MLIFEYGFANPHIGITHAPSGATTMSEYSQPYPQQPYQQQPGPPPGYGQPYPYQQETRKHSGLATAALVLGIIGFVFACIPFVNYIAYPIVLLAIVFGIIAIKWGKAKAGLILGVLGLIATILWSIGIAGAFSHASHQVDKYQQCVNRSQPGDNSNCDQYLND